MLNARSKLAAARLRAVRTAPYFASALIGLVPREVPLGTLSKDGTLGVSKRGVLSYEAAAVDRWTTEELSGVLLHEVSHWLRNHADRCERAGYDHKLFNEAGDLEINDDLVAMGVKLPDSPLLPVRYGFKDGCTAEEYYGLLKKNEPPPDPNQPPPPPSTTPGSGGCGGCAGNPNAGEDDNDPGAPGRSDADMGNIRREVAEAIKSAASHGRGSVPAGWERWADVAVQAPQIPWQSKLARLCRTAVAYRAGAVDYRHSRPSRRQSAVGYGPGKPVLPGLISPMPRAAFVLDTSASCGTQEVSEGVAEAGSIMRTLGVPIDFCAADAAVHSLAEVKSARDILPLIKGGGGTDFRPVFEALLKRKPRPELVVFATDGDGPAPDAPPPGMRVIWLLVGPYKRKPYTANHAEVEWGEVVEITRKDP